MNYKHDIDRILNKEDYGIGETTGVNGVLARMYRTILKNIKLPAYRFHSLLSEYADKEKAFLEQSGNTDHKMARLLMPSNVRRELEKEKMTFKVFIKGLRILKVKKVIFTCTLINQSGKETSHTVDVDLGLREMPGDEFDDPVGD